MTVYEIWTGPMKTCTFQNRADALKYAEALAIEAQSRVIVLEVISSCIHIAQPD